MQYWKSILYSSIILLTFTTIGIVFYFFYTNFQTDLILAVIIVYYFVNLAFSLFLFNQNRQLKGKIAWFVIFNSLPVLGHIIFSIFGQRFPHRKSYKEYYENVGFKLEKQNLASSTLKPYVQNLFNKQSQLSQRGIYKVDATFYESGNEVYNKIFEDLKKAKKFIHIQFYILKPGEIWEHFKAILLQKIKEGVKIRFIVDDFGKWLLPISEINYLRDAGIDLGVFNKVYFPFISSHNGYRFHRKMVLIDGKIVHTGGINITDEYASFTSKYGFWLDFQARLTGPAVRSYSILFLQDWKLVSNEKLEFDQYLLESQEGSSETILIEDSPENKIPVLEDSLVQMILQARKEINLVSPYFVPTPKLYAALRTALLEGVKINLFIPGLADKKCVLPVTKFYADKLQVYGAKVYQVQNIFVHSKIALFDQEYAYFGTTNLDSRSLYSQFEHISLLAGPEVAKINSTFNYYKKISKIIPKGHFSNSGFKKQVLIFYAKLLSCIM